MNITTEQCGINDAETYIIRNKGRVIARFARGQFIEYCAAIHVLGKLTAQLQRPEAFCDCKPTEEAR